MIWGFEKFNLLCIVLFLCVLSVTYKLMRSFMLQCNYNHVLPDDVVGGKQDYPKRIAKVLTEA